MSSVILNPFTGNFQLGTTGGGGGGGITALTGDVTATGPGSVPATISNLVVTNAKIANATIDLTTKVTGALPIANGGTGQVTANAALNVLLPLQTGNVGKILQTDGSNTSWQTFTTGANTALSNLTSPTAINESLTSDTNNTDDLGSDSIEWKDLWVHSIKHNDVTNPDLVVSTTGNNGNISLSAEGSGIVTSNTIIRLPNNTQYTSRNAANNADIGLIKLNTSDNIEIGNTDTRFISTATFSNSIAIRWIDSTSSVNSAIRLDGADIFHAGINSFPLRLEAASISLWDALGTPVDLRFMDADSSNYVAFKAASVVTSNITWTLPNVDGTSGQVLSTDGSGTLSWTTATTTVTNNKELTILSAGDITNQYIDLAHVARTNSISFLVKGGGVQIEGASYDYSVNYTGGSGGNTRITFLNDLATGGSSALIAGDVVVVQYEY